MWNGDLGMIQRENFTEKAMNILTPQTVLSFKFDFQLLAIFHHRTKARGREWDVD